MRGFFMHFKINGIYIFSNRLYCEIYILLTDDIWIEINDYIYFMNYFNLNIDDSVSNKYVNYFIKNNKNYKLYDYYRVPQKKDNYFFNHLSYLGQIDEENLEILEFLKKEYVN